MTPKNPAISVVQKWPRPDTVSKSTVAQFGSTLVVGYGTGDEEYVLISFAHATNVKWGGPNDEALQGHPLFAFGLQHYSVHRIENSSWLVELETQNSIHPRHDRKRFMQDKIHYLFALKEETIECIVREQQDTQATIEVFSSQGEAIESLKARICS